MVNADREHLWSDDVSESVQMYNTWFLTAAPNAYREQRAKATDDIELLLLETSDLRYISPDILLRSPQSLPGLRMCTSPALARDRLIGLSGVPGSLVLTLERGFLPPRMLPSILERHLTRICEVITQLLDRDVFPWLQDDRPASPPERVIAATVIADRLCGSTADPIIRNAQERRQLDLLAGWLEGRNYVRQAHPASASLDTMAVGTYTFRQNVVVGDTHNVNIPVDALIQPFEARPSGYPLLLEAKSAGDFTNTNKRRKEEATKIHQLRAKFGPDISLTLFLCGYFDQGYLAYEAAEGIDWVWEHRIEDLEALGV